MASSMDPEQAPQLQQSVAAAAGGGTQNHKVEELSNETNKKKKGKSYFPKFVCFRIQHDATGDGFDMDVVDASGQGSNPTHLIIMVNGLVGR